MGNYEQPTDSFLWHVAISLILLYTYLIAAASIDVRMGDKCQSCTVFVFVIIFTSMFNAKRQASVESKQDFFNLALRTGISK